MNMNHWKTGLAVVISIVLSALGIKPFPAAADPVSSKAPIAQTQPAQTCEYGGQPKLYARVITKRDPLRVRSSPNGRIIGSIPRGWAVVVERKDSTGRWVRVTSHFGDLDGFVFPSAPDFSAGWVSASFLQNLGSHCEKPMATSSLLRSDLLSGREALIQEDWVELGDLIASTPMDP